MPIEGIEGMEGRGTIEGGTPMEGRGTNGEEGKWHHQKVTFLFGKLMK